MGYFLVQTAAISGRVTVHIQVFVSKLYVEVLYLCDPMICTSGVAMLNRILVVLLNIGKSVVPITDSLADLVTNE